MCEGVYKPVETYFQSTRSMVLGVLGVALCVSGCSGYLQSGEFYCTSKYLGESLGCDVGFVTKRGQNVHAIVTLTTRYI